MSGGAACLRVDTPFGRFYKTPEGAYVPSVTSLLSVLSKPGVEKWQREKGFEEADRLRDEASALGTYVHGLIDQVNHGRVFSVAELEAIEQPARIMVLQYQRWAREHVAGFVYSERYLVSRRYGFAGACDAVLLLNDHGRESYATIDYKISDSHGDSWPLQLSAYREMLYEEGITADRRLVVRFEKGEKQNTRLGDMTFPEYKDHATDFDDFLAARQLWHRFNAWKIAKVEREADKWQAVPA